MNNQTSNRKDRIQHSIKHSKILKKFKHKKNSKKRNPPTDRSKSRKLTTRRPPQSRITTNRTQQNRITTNRTQQNRITTNRTQQNRITTNRTQQNRITTNRTQQNRTNRNKSPNQKKYEKYKPIGKNLVKADFVCIFCFEVPNLKDGRGVVICPHCRYPAHANEFHQWSLSSALCSRCDSPLPIGNSKHLKIIPVNEYVKIIKFFTKRKK